MPRARRSLTSSTCCQCLLIEWYPNGYLAYFPALEGYNTWGKTYEEAIKHAEGTLTLYLESFDELGKSIPEGEVSNNPPPPG
jgi:predicted RNase H-like HicB family nuclease